MRFFNTAGPVDCVDHYCLNPLERFDLPEVLELIDQKKYFVLHAPRQTGKTSCLLALMKYLNDSGSHRALYANIEMAQAAREDVTHGIRAVVQTLAIAAREWLKEPQAPELARSVLEHADPLVALYEFLTLWTQTDTTRGSVLFLDEIDSLVGDTLISVLRQLRTGYSQRGASFPQSVILCGVRNVQDYRIHSSKEKAVVTGGSAFNVKAESLRLGDFNRQEMERLYTEHTRETGQLFTPEAMEEAWELTRGQPWLVNALGYETCFKIKTGRDRSRPVTDEMMARAAENLIGRRETHLDQLVDKLQEERVRRVISPMLRGEDMEKHASLDDIQYVADLGLIRREASGPQIANAIYREVIPRELTFITQLNLESMITPAWYLLPDGRIDMGRLLTAFQEFFREHSEHWVERFQYREAGPQLLLQAFLQRIVNGGGRIEREYGLGHMRTDLLVIWPVRAPEGEPADGRQVNEPPEVQKEVIELKLLRKSMAETLRTGLAQTWEHMDRCGVAHGHLVIFDRTLDKPWEEKIFRREEHFNDRPITVWGM